MPMKDMKKTGTDYNDDEAQVQVVEEGCESETPYLFLLPCYQLRVASSFSLYKSSIQSSMEVKIKQKIYIYWLN